MQFPPPPLKATCDTSQVAFRTWSDYQHHHDLSGKAGQTAGINPVSGCIWFDDSIRDVIEVEMLHQRGDVLSHQVAAQWAIDVRRAAIGLVDRQR